MTSVAKLQCLSFPHRVHFSTHTGFTFFFAHRVCFSLHTARYPALSEILLTAHSTVLSSCNPSIVRIPPPSPQLLTVKPPNNNPNSNTATKGKIAVVACVMMVRCRDIVGELGTLMTSLMNLDLGHKKLSSSIRFDADSANNLGTCSPPRRCWPRQS